MMKFSPVIIVFAIGCGVALGWLSPAAGGNDELTVPWGLKTFIPEEGCQWQRSGLGFEDLPRNAHYLAGPRPGQDWQAWLAKLRSYRESVRTRLHDPRLAEIALRFDGVRAWIRADRGWAWAADLAPGETIRLCGEARSLEGNGTLGLAMDWCDRSRGADGAWAGWSTVFASAAIAQDGAWHRFEIAANVPKFESATRWARPILGMDGTFDRRPGSMLLRNLTLSLPRTAAREKRLSSFPRSAWERTAGRSAARVDAPQSGGTPVPTQSVGTRMDDSVYRRADLAWMTRNFVCGFVLVYDRSFWDPERRQYRVGPLCEEAQREFGGFDSVVLWHAYPRIGADERNQFDFFRDMPGGLPGVRNVVREFHQRGVKVFLPYNPWDTGTAREKHSDDQALAALTAAVEADGIFLDTMVAAPTGLRQAMDAARPGVAFEPEGHPAIEEMSICSGSWAQWLSEYPEIGVLHLKWLEPRHIQHQIRRWDKSHQHEIAAAWLNGSGILVWENIFGTWNPWNGEDRAALRRMAPVLRHFADLLAEGEWLPYFPTRVEKVYASCWKDEKVRLWTLVSLSGRKVDGPVLEVDDQCEQFIDLWRGERLEPERVGGKIRLSVPLESFGAIAALNVSFRAPKGRNMTAQGNALGKRVEPDDEALKGRNSDSAERLSRPFRATDSVTGSFPRALPWAVTLRPFGAETDRGKRISTVRPLWSLLEAQRREALRAVPKPDADAHVGVRSVIDAKPVPACPPADPKKTAGMLQMKPATKTFVVRHMRRECGCYPDPGTPASALDRFLVGTPHDGTIEHRVTATLGPYWIDPKPVTNRQFEVFLKATGYKPQCPDRFLHHWGGAACPAELSDKPVVYVDLEDARAYAAWAGTRLPTEWEWQHAAEERGRESFSASAGESLDKGKSTTPARKKPPDPLCFEHSEVFEWTESQRDDGHTRFVMLRGGSRYHAKGSIWYFPGGPQPIQSHAKFLLLDSGLDRCATIGFRCVVPE